MEHRFIFEEPIDKIENPGGVYKVRKKGLYGPFKVPSALLHSLVILESVFNIFQMSKWDFKEMNVNHVWKAMFKATFGMLFFLVCTADKSSKALSWELLKIVGIKCQLVLVWCEKGKTVAICGDLDLLGLSSRYSLSNFFCGFSFVTGFAVFWMRLF